MKPQAHTTPETASHSALPRLAYGGHVKTCQIGNFHSLMGAGESAPVGYIADKAELQEILHRCNSHDRLTAQNRRLVNVLERILESTKRGVNSTKPASDAFIEFAVIETKCRTLLTEIAKEGGE